MQIVSHYLTVDTADAIDILNITSAIQQTVAATGIRQGYVVVPEKPPIRLFRDDYITAIFQAKTGPVESDNWHTQARKFKSVRSSFLDKH
ncbi:MAG: hypothetical protein ACFB14_19230 [Leptolyngbyaceae cyanobacterium]